MADDEQVKRWDAFRKYVQLSEHMNEAQDLPIMVCPGCIEPGSIRLAAEGHEFFCLNCDQRWWVQ